MFFDVEESVSEVIDVLSYRIESMGIIIRSQYQNFEALAAQ